MSDWIPGLDELTYYWDDLRFLPCAIYQIFPWIVAAVFVGMAVNRTRPVSSGILTFFAVVLGYFFLTSPLVILMFPSFTGDLDIDIAWMWLRVAAVVVFLAIGIRALMKRSKGAWEWAAIIATGLLFFEFGLSVVFGDYRGP